MNSNTKLNTNTNTAIKLGKTEVRISDENAREKEIDASIAREEATRIKAQYDYNKRHEKDKK